MGKKNVFLFIVNLILIILIIGLMSIHWWSMSKNRNDIDQLIEALDEFKTFVPETTTISLYSNIPNSKNDSDLFRNLVYKCQFVLAPRIVIREFRSDTVLYVQFNKFIKLENLAFADTLKSVKRDSFNIYLLINKNFK